MDIPRRENFRTWFGEVGYLYLVVILIVSLVFLFRDLKSELPSYTQGGANAEKADKSQNVGR